MKALSLALFLAVAGTVLSVEKSPRLYLFSDRAAYVFGIYFFSQGTNYVYSVEVNEGENWFGIATFTDVPKGQPVSLYTVYGSEAGITYRMGIARLLSYRTNNRAAKDDAPSPWTRWRLIPPVEF